MKSTRAEEWKGTVLSANSSIRNALEVLEHGPGPIVLAVGAGDELVGTVSDGDVRRGLLSGLALDDPLSLIMNPHPYRVQDGQSLDGIGEVLARLMIHAIPIVNSAGCPVGLVTRKQSKKVPVEFDALVLAGGKGSRLLPLTRHTPKPLVSISGRHLIDIQIERLLDSGAKRVYVATNHLSEVIETHISENYGDESPVACLVEDQPRGTAGALSLLPIETSHNVIVTNVDVIHDFDISKMLGFHVRNSFDATLAVTEQFVSVPFGVVQFSGTEFQSIVEKPEVPFRISTGITVTSPAFRAMIGAESIDMPSALMRARAGGLKVGVLEGSGYWRDVGVQEDLEAARSDLRIETD